MLRTGIIAIFLVFYFLVSLPMYVVIPIIGRFDGRRADWMSQHMVTWALGVIIFLSGVKVTVNGADNIPADQAVLFICNHRSYFDIITTYPQMISLTGYVAKDSINDVPLFKYWMPLLHGLTFDRDDPRSGMKMILAAVDQIKSGYSMFIFPEGTRSKDGSLGEFKAGSFKIATKTDCPIVPVAITGTAAIFEDHLPIVKPSDVTITFLEPIIPSQMAPDDKKHIGVYVRSIVADAIEKQS